MRFLSILIILLFYISPIFSQQVKIGFQSGIGKYEMTDLKEINTQILENSKIIGSKLTSNYPQYYYYKPSLVLSYKTLSFGLTYSQQSTGSRISVKDYSGEYRFDSKVKSHGLGITSEICIIPANRLKLSMYTELGILSIKVNIVDYFQVFEENIFDSNTDYTSKNYYFEPGLKLSYLIYIVGIEINLGYCYQFGKSALQVKNTTLAPYGNDIQPNWSGLRAGMSLYFDIPLKAQ